MTDDEKNVFSELQTLDVHFEQPTWETCRSWLRERDWKINVLSDYPGGEIKFTVRKGFERIEVAGKSDLEVMGRAIFEVARRRKVNPED